MALKKPSSRRVPGRAASAKTDRLILPSFLKDAAEDKRLDEKELKAAHAVLVKWADLETSGRLAELNETQMQGDFLAQVFAMRSDTPDHSTEKRSGTGSSTITSAMRRRTRFWASFDSRGPQALAVIELKDRQSTSTASAATAARPWASAGLSDERPVRVPLGIVSNIVSFRLYERRRREGLRTFHATIAARLRRVQAVLRALSSPGLDRRFASWAAARRGLAEAIDGTPAQGRDQLYDAYSVNRANLIAELHQKRNFPLDQAIEMAQRLFDRIIFIAFCEDRRLLPEKMIRKAYTVAGIHAVTNPRWRQFKNLFAFVNEGNEPTAFPATTAGCSRRTRSTTSTCRHPWTTFSMPSAATTSPMK